jgi:hypothetical protein
MANMFHQASRNILSRVGSGGQSSREGNIIIASRHALFFSGKNRMADDVIDLEDRAIT